MMATGEKSCSKLKIIEKYLRTTLAQERLGGRILLPIEKEAASIIGCRDFIEEFAAIKSRKVNFV